MIQTIDRAIEGFLRRLVPLSEQAVDVSFEAPDRTWGAALTRPTANVFLWDINRSPGGTRTGLETRQADDGRIERRPATPIVDLHYLVTAWATEVEDEHTLLGSVLECVLAHPKLPDDILPAPLSGKRCGLALAPGDGRVPGEFWSALGGRLKPGLQLVVTLPVDVFAWKPAGIPAASIAVTTGRDVAPPSQPSPPVATSRRRLANGALVMEGRGAEASPDDAG